MSAPFLQRLTVSQLKTPSCVDESHASLTEASTSFLPQSSREARSFWERPGKILYCG